MRVRLCCLVAGLLPLSGLAQAQVPLYAQSLPEGTVYIRLANALPGAVTVQTDFAGKVSLGGDGAARVSPYYVAGDAGGRSVALQVTRLGKTGTARFEPRSGSFVTVILEERGGVLTAAAVTDKPEYNQLRARLSFYNATSGCDAGSLADASNKAIFSALPPNSGQARSINPVAAKVVASCAAGKASPLDLGHLEPGGLYSVWMMQPAGSLTAFVAHDTIAPPQT